MSKHDGSKELLYIFRLPLNHPTDPGRYEVDVENGFSEENGGIRKAGPFKDSSQANDLAIKMEREERLRKLWFVFGNYGPKHTDAGHKFIQKCLAGEDLQELKDFYNPPGEVIVVVESILEGC